MTIPSRIQEILAEMERDPALATELRERILGQEFSQVPQAVAQNQNLITHMMERQIQLSEQFANAVEAQNQSLTRIENSVSEFRQETQTAISGLYGETQTAISGLYGETQTAISEFRQETGSALERFEGRLDQGLGEVRSELSEFRQETQTHFEEVRSELSELRQETRSELRGTNGRLDRGFGANYEAKTTSNIRSILGQQLGIRNSRVLKGPNLRTDEDLESLLEQAESSGAITEEEADELLLLDLIVAGTHRADHARVYVAAEISITANQDDVNRAADRAEILWRVTGFPSRPVVIADRISEPCRKLADEKEVAVAIYPE